MAVIICNETQGSAESIQHIHFARAGLLPEAFTNIWQLNLAHSCPTELTYNKIK